MAERRMRVSYSTIEIDQMMQACLDPEGREAAGEARVDVKQLRALLDQARIVSLLADGPTDTGGVLLVRCEALRVVERRLVQLAPGDTLVRRADVEQAMRELSL